MPRRPNRRAGNQKSRRHTERMSAYLEPKDALRVERMARRTGKRPAILIREMVLRGLLEMEVRS